MARGFMDGYKTNPGARGSTYEWRGSFKERLGLDAARATVRDESPWAILGVGADATWEQIRKAHRLLAFQFHPDNQSTGDAAAFRRVRAAFEILEDRHK